MRKEERQAAESYRKRGAVEHGSGIRAASSGSSAKGLSKPPAPSTPNFDKALACFSIALTGQQGKLDRMDFQTRRMFQQTIFLLQKLGTDFGYKFELTVVGVYSKRLGQDMRDRYG